MGLNWDDVRQKIEDVVAGRYKTYFFAERVFAPDNPRAVCLTAAWDKKGRVQIIPINYKGRDLYIVRGHRPGYNMLSGVLFIDRNDGSVIDYGYGSGDVYMELDPIEAAVNYVIGERRGSSQS